MGGNPRWLTWRPLTTAARLRSLLFAGAVILAMVTVSGASTFEQAMSAPWAAAATPTGQAIVNAAASQSNVHYYCWAGGGSSGPSHGQGNGDGEADDCASQATVGYDCAGLVTYAVYVASGGSITLPRPSETQGADYPQYGGTLISNQSDLKPGDIVFLGGGSMSYATHEGVYAGGGLMWDADTAYSWNGGSYPNGVYERSLANEEASLSFDGAVRFWSSGGSESQWRFSPVPNPTQPPGSDANYQAVSCPSSSFCATGGDYFITCCRPGQEGGTQALLATFRSGTWQLTAPRNSANRGFGGISCTSPSFCAAVGGGAHGAGGQIVPKAMVATLEDGTWSVTTLPNVGDTFNAVSCSSDRSCVAVGSAGDGTLIDILQDGKWVAVSAVDQFGAMRSGLSGVACTSPSSCVAVGGAIGVPGRPADVADVPVVETLNNGTWSATDTAVPLPTGPAGTNGWLSAVSCLSARSCVAVGDYSFGDGPDHALIETFSGSSWSLAQSPYIANLQSSLSGVSCSSPTRCAAVGVAFRGLTDHALIETLTDGAWVLTTGAALPSHSGNSNLSAISCNLVGLCLAVGGPELGKTQAEIGPS